LCRARQAHDPGPRQPRARRLFLARHALAEAPTGPATGQALHDLIARIGFVQVDSINTVARILSPFDPALRDRDRAEFPFGLRYRIEVFVPGPRRVFGDCVFPLLEGDGLVGRTDVKAVRDAGSLRVRAFWPEAGVRLARARMAGLEAELDRLARFAGCARVAFLDGWPRAATAAPDGR